VLVGVLGAALAAQDSGCPVCCKKQQPIATSVKLIAPSGSTPISVSGTVLLKAELQWDRAKVSVARVRFCLDGHSVAEACPLRPEASLDTRPFSNGIYQVTVHVYEFDRNAPGKIGKELAVSEPVTIVIGNEHE